MLKLSTLLRDLFKYQDYHNNIPLTISLMQQLYHNNIFSFNNNTSNTSKL